MRKLLALLALPLAACSSGDAVPTEAEGEEKIACALAGAKDFAPVCAVDRSKEGDSLILIVRHPDGAFRRFMVLNDGRGVAVADGATQAVTRFEQGFAELAVDRDRYRFPVTVKGHGQRK